jgi:hypothetical protein
MTLPLIVAQQNTGPASLGDLSNPLAVNTPQTPNLHGDPAAVATFSLVTTVAGSVRVGDYTVGLVPHGAVDHTADFRLGDGSTWGAWGGSFTFAAARISSDAPTVVHVQFSTGVSDPPGQIACGLMLPQDGVLMPTGHTADTTGAAVVVVARVVDTTGAGAVSGARTGDATGAAAVIHLTTGDTTGAAAVRGPYTGDTTGGADIILFNDFSSGQSLASWLSTATAGSGTATVTSNQLKLLGGAAADAAIVRHAASLDLGKTRLYQHKATAVSVGAGGANLISLWRNASNITPSDNTTINASWKSTLQQDGSGAIAITVNTATAQYWNFSTGAWQTGAANYAGTVGTAYVVDFEHNATQFRYTLRDASGNPLGTHPTTDWINFADLTGSGSTYWLWAGEPYTNYYYCDLRIAFIKVFTE